MAISTTCKACGIELTAKHENELVSEVQAHLAEAHPGPSTRCRNGSDASRVRSGASSEWSPRSATASKSSPRSPQCNQHSTRLPSACFDHLLGVLAVIAVVVVCVAVLAGAGSGAFLIVVMCALMMGAMVSLLMRGMGGMGGRDRG